MIGFFRPTRKVDLVFFFMRVNLAKKLAKQVLEMLHFHEVLMWFIYHTLRLSLDGCDVYRFLFSKKNAGKE